MSVAKFSIFDSEAGDRLEFDHLPGSGDTSWERGKIAEAEIKVLSAFGFRVRLPDGGWHIVALARDGDEFVGACDCKGFEYNNGPCAHLCVIRKAGWRGVTLTRDVNGRKVRIQQIGDPDLSMLPEKQREAFEAVELGDMGVREYQREKGYSSPGTVSNHLRAARETIAELQEQRAAADAGQVEEAGRRDAAADERRVAGEEVAR